MDEFLARVEILTEFNRIYEMDREIKKLKSEISMMSHQMSAMRDRIKRFNENNCW